MGVELSESGWGCVNPDEPQPRPLESRRSLAQTGEGEVGSIRSICDAGMTRFILVRYVRDAVAQDLSAERRCRAALK